MRPALLSVVAATGITVLALVTPQPAANLAANSTTNTAPAADLVASVTQQLLTTHEQFGKNRRPVVDVTREQGDWAFGTAVLAGTPGRADTEPFGWLFLANRGANGWRLGFEGQPAFGELAKATPLVAADEREVLAAQDGSARPNEAGGDYRTGMALPFAVGMTWTMSGGPHGWAGTDLPYSSVDLYGGDQVVRAARAGTAYTMCRGWLRVFHDRGYATDYYHLWNNINVNGVAVAQGTRLGDTGTDVTCGGAANGRHVHFALRQNNVYVGIGGHNVGGWVPIAGAAYGGYALHGSAIRYPGGALYNYGGLGFNQGIIDANGGTYVNKRSGPGSGYAIIGSVADGTHVTVSCSANGTTHTGRWGTTSLWNRLTDGTWVSDAFMWTGLNAPINGWC